MLETFLSDLTYRSYQMVTGDFVQLATITSFSSRLGEDNVEIGKTMIARISAIMTHLFLIAIETSFGECN